MSEPLQHFTDNQAIPDPELLAAREGEGPPDYPLDAPTSNTYNTEDGNPGHAVTRHYNTYNTYNTNPAEGETAESPSRDWRTYRKDGEWLESQEFPPLQYMVPGVLSEGFGVMVAPPKAGKSWLSLGFCLSVCTGGKALGYLPVQKRPAVYFALEDGDKRMKRRLKKLLRDQDLPREFEYFTDIPGDLVAKAIVGWLRENGPGLIIIDTLAKVRPITRNSESEYDRDYRFGSEMKGICEGFPGCCILVVHHTRKARDDEDWMNSTLGSQGINGSADYTMGLSRRRGLDDGTLRIVGRDIDEAEYAVVFDDGAWTLEGGTLEASAQAVDEKRQTESLGGIQARIVQYINSHPEGVTALMVSEAIDEIDKKTASTYLGRLTDSDRVLRLGRGTYGPRISVGVESVGSVVMPSQPVYNNTPACVVSVENTPQNATMAKPEPDQDGPFQEALDLYEENPAPCQHCGKPRDKASIATRHNICTSCELENLS